jgi:antirestriction protein
MRIYVGTYAKYNDGNLFGKWLDLADYNDKDEFYEACKELHADEEDPELMFQDWEEIPHALVSECSIDPVCWDLMKAFDEHDEDAVRAYIKCFQDRYYGEYSSWTDLAEQLLEETGGLDQIPEHLRYYFDYEKYGQNLRCDFCEEDGHYFWNN